MDQGPPWTVPEPEPLAEGLRVVVTAKPVRMTCEGCAEKLPCHFVEFETGGRRWLCEECQKAPPDAPEAPPALPLRPPGWKPKPIRPRRGPQIISRPEARKLGLRRYFTGKACRHGHVAERMTSNGTCLRCVTLLHNRTPASRARIAAWGRTEKGKAVRRHYRRSAAGRAMLRRFYRRRRERAQQGGAEHGVGR